MIFHERTKQCRVCTGGFHGIDSIDKVADTAACGLEGLSDPEVPAFV